MRNRRGRNRRRRNRRRILGDTPARFPSTCTSRTESERERVREQDATDL